MDTLRPHPGLVRMEIRLIQNAPALATHRHQMAAIFSRENMDCQCRLSLRHRASSEEERETTMELMTLVAQRVAS